MMSNLERAQTALEEVDSVSAQLHTRLAELESLSQRSEDGGETLALPTMLEVARSLRRASNDLCFFIAAEALDRGCGPAVLDWNGD